MRKHLTSSSYITARLGSVSNNDSDRRESVTIKTSSGLKSAGIISICLKCQMREISQELNSWRPNLSLEVACVQTSPISFVARGKGTV